MKKKIIIAGGGIGGAAAALSLLKRGFDVEVYEQAPELGEVGAGIQISPNGSRALHALGVFETLRDLSCAPERKEFRLWNTGRQFPLFDLGDSAIEKYGFPYLTVYRPDLLGTLVDAARGLKPDVFHLGKAARSFEQDDKGVTLRLADGTTATGHVLIGADGVKTAIRRQMWGDEEAKFKGLVAWRAVISMDLLPDSLRQMVGWTWIGPGAHLVNYPLRGGTLMNMVGTVENGTWAEEGYHIIGDKAECLKDFAGWHPIVQTLIQTAPQIVKWAFVERTPRPVWGQGRVSLLGDACHATLPFLAQGAVMSIEDGVILGRCLEAFDDVEVALKHYEGARVERTTAMVRGAKDNTGRFHSDELATEETAAAYMEREWSREPITGRYDWLYQYDVETAAI